MVDHFLFEDTIQGTLQNNIIQYSSKNHMRVVMWKQVNVKMNLTYLWITPREG